MKVSSFQEDSPCRVCPWLHTEGGNVCQADHGGGVAALQSHKQISLDSKGLKVTTCPSREQVWLVSPGMLLERVIMYVLWPLSWMKGRGNGSCHFYYPLRSGVPEKWSSDIQSLAMRGLYFTVYSYKFKLMNCETKRANFVQ